MMSTMRRTKDLSSPTQPLSSSSSRFCRLRSAYASVLPDERRMTSWRASTPPRAMNSARKARSLMRERSEKVASLSTDASPDESLSTISTASSMGDDTSVNLRHLLGLVPLDDIRPESDLTHVVAFSSMARMLSWVTSAPESLSRRAKRVAGSATWSWLEAHSWRRTSSSGTSGSMRALTLRVP